MFAVELSPMNRHRVVMMIVFRFHCSNIPAAWKQGESQKDFGQGIMTI